MKNRWYRFFWTEMGRRLVSPDSEPPEPPPGMPAPLLSVLSAALPLPPVPEPSPPPGGMLPHRSNRYVYSLVWEILRPEGFSRPLHLRPWTGVELLVPFYRGSVCVLPQSFAPRVPSRERALSLVGRSLACSMEGFRMITVLGRWTEEVLAILSAGGVRFCSLDGLGETVAAGR